MRIVTVPGYDVCACCAPHVSRTGEIGLIKLVDAVNYKGGTRVTMVCGFRALEDYRMKEDNVREISRLLSAKPHEVAEAVERLREEALLWKGKAIQMQTRYLEKKLEELTVKIEDIETLVDEVADVAYDKAVEVVSDTVRMETHKEDIRLIEETQNWLRSPERKAPKKEREYAIDRLDGVVKKIRNSMQNALNKLQTVLMKPSVKNAGKEKIKEKAKESIYSKLARAKISADTDNQARWEQQKHQTNRKKDMEL